MTDSAASSKRSSTTSEDSGVGFDARPGSDSLKQQTGDAEKPGATPNESSGSGEAEEEPWYEKMGEAGITFGLVALILVLRLFAVANWNWEIAASLVDSFNLDDAISIILGTLFERPRVSGVLIAIALPLAIFRDYLMARHRLSKNRANNWFIIVALLATVYVLIRSFEIWWMLIMALVLTAILIGGSAVVRNKGWNQTFSRLGAHVGILFGFSLLVLAGTVDTPWVERELIDTKEGPMYGYVIETPSGFLKVLTEDREVLIIPDSQVVSRTITPVE